jgi:Flp pilus assembly secretin CpaC
LILSGLSENEKTNEKDGVPLLQNIPILQYFFSNENELETKKSVIILLTPRRPQFVNGKTIDHNLIKRSQQEQQNSIHTQELMKKYDMKITRNTDAALAVLEGGELYREFRAGDLKLDDWYDGDTLAGSLKRTLNFLYY